MRVCIFGAAPAPEWQRALVAALPAHAQTQTFAETDAASALRAAARQFPGEDLVLLRSGVALPPFWLERLLPALELTDVLVASPLDNADPATAPLPAGTRSDADPQRIDALCWAHGRHDAIDWPRFSPLLSAWNGTALRKVNAEHVRNEIVPPAFAPAREGRPTRR